MFRCSRPDLDPLSLRGRAALSRGGMVKVTPAATSWRKSRACAASNGCVEVGRLEAGTVAARDSVLGEESPMLPFRGDDFRDFILNVKNGAFDLR